MIRVCERQRKLVRERKESERDRESGVSCRRREREKERWKHIVRALVSAVERERGLERS